MATADGWPFLIARGRRKGYSVLLAPGFLVAEQDYGFLENVVGPVRDGRPCHTATTTTPRGRRVSLVWSDYPAGEVCSDADLRDEHSRPLRLLGGFLSVVDGIGQPSEVDLVAARTAAGATYGRFLADEEGFTVEESAPFGLRSEFAPRPRVVVAPQAGVAPKRPDALLVTMGLGLAVLVGVVVILVSSAGGGGAQQPPSCAPTLSATTTGVVIATEPGSVPTTVPRTC